MKQDVVELMLLGVGEFAIKWGSMPTEIEMNKETLSRYRKFVTAKGYNPIEQRLGLQIDYFNGIKISVNYIVGKNMMWFLNGMKIHIIRIAEDTEEPIIRVKTETKIRRMLRPIK
jgi:hypothetical protein